MREIRFRGMSVSGWVYGHYVVITDGLGGLVECIQEVGNDGATPVRKETVSQYTGLKDVNDKKIYEGDIIKYVYRKPMLPELYVVKDMSNYHDMRILEKIISKPLSTVEVIGNIYENPELL